MTRRAPHRPDPDLLARAQAGDRDAALELWRRQHAAHRPGRAPAAASAAPPATQAPAGRPPDPRPRPTPDPDNPREALIQQALAVALDQRLGRGRWYHVPNGGWRDARTAAELRAEGVHLGVADVVCLPTTLCGCKGLYLELKRLKGGTVRPHQREFLDAAAAEGYRTAVARGLAAALAEVAAAYGPHPASDAAAWLHLQELLTRAR